MFDCEFREGKEGGKVLKKMVRIEYEERDR
jgi:hypothetical protein